jgi:hypothetical protein
MHRHIIGLAFVTVLLAGCATPGPQDKGLYHAPARAYSLALDSAAFRGAVTLTEQCDAKGGTLNIWDKANRFFRIDYLKIGQHPMANVPTFASERTITEQVLSNYLRDVLPKAENIESSESLLREFVDTGRGDAMFGVVSIRMKSTGLPDSVLDNNYYYGFLVFTRGDMVYVIQHRVDTYQPDRLKQLLSALRQDMLVPGALRPGDQINPAAATEQMKDGGKVDPNSILARCG